MLPPLDSFKLLVEADNGEGAIDLILHWIREESSKVARGRLDQFKNDHSSNSMKLQLAYTYWISAKERKNAPDTTVEWALTIPFVSIRVKYPVASATAKRTHSKMLGDVTINTASQVLKDAYGYNVRFRQWESLHGDIFDDNNIQQDNANRLPEIVMSLIEDSYKRGCRPSEIQELAFYADTIRGLLSRFGFELKVNSPPADDFIFSSMSNDEDFLFGEAAQISALPNQPLPSGTSHELCLFGFATHVAKYNPDASPTLTALLDIKATIKNEKKNEPTLENEEKNDCLASEMAQSLLKQGEGILEVAEII
jgi:hypothetical protein